MTDFLVKKDDLRTCRIEESDEAPSIEPGEALLRVDTFGLTANNITYAVMGEAMSYWNFFPAADGWGRVPMWGFAEVERSEAEGVEPGTRLYGYLPPSSHLVVTAADAGERGFVDASPHRVSLPSAYHRYLASGTDPFYKADTEDVQMLLRPLFFTSFLIDDQLADDGLVDRGPDPDLERLEQDGDRRRLHARPADGRRPGRRSPPREAPSSSRGSTSTAALSPTTRSTRSRRARPPTSTSPATARSAAPSTSTSATSSPTAWPSALTHWEELGAGGDGELPGPTPTLFFAPDRVVKRSADWGQAGLETRVADAWHPFCEWIGGWLEVVHGEGFEAVQSAYLDVIEGQVEPKTAHVLKL